MSYELQIPRHLSLTNTDMFIGNGGITALAMMIVSDVVTLENRGK